MNRLLAVALAAASFSCATSRPAPIAPRQDIATLCDRLTAEACTGAGRGAAPEDVATVVLGTLSESDGALASVLASVQNLDPSERKAAMVKAFSEAAGTTWSCAPFDTMWASQPVSCTQ